MKVTNVKAVIYDKTNKFLSGYNSISNDNKYHYSLLGGHSEKKETAFETMKREVFEESSMVLNLETDGKKFYLLDFKNQTIPLQLDGVLNDNGKLFVFLFANVYLEEYIESWRKKFHWNQSKLVLQLGKFKPEDISKIPYYLENQDLVLITPRQMKEKDGLYERQILLYV
jgi:8-oxo-dGTP pyrophosphatase MutT (NUDIX family)